MSFVVCLALLLFSSQALGSLSHSSAQCLPLTFKWSLIKHTDKQKLFKETDPYMVTHNAVEPVFFIQFDLHDRYVKAIYIYTYMYIYIHTYKSLNFLMSFHAYRSVSWVDIFKHDYFQSQKANSIKIRLCFYYVPKSHKWSCFHTQKWLSLLPSPRLVGRRGGGVWGGGLLCQTDLQQCRLPRGPPVTTPTACTDIPDRACLFFFFISRGLDLLSPTIWAIS